MIWMTTKYKKELKMDMPSLVELGIIVLVFMFLVLPTRYIAKKRGLSFRWHMTWVLLFSPLWWIVMLFLKPKTTPHNFEYE